MRYTYDLLNDTHLRLEDLEVLQWLIKLE
jgi:hypothetical protein